MDLLPTTEQEEIAAAARSFLAKELPESRIRQLADEEMNVDAPVWSAVAQLGWFALGLPEDLGGVGYGLPEEVMLFREIGRHLAPGPFASTALAARVAARAGDAALASEIVEGMPVGLALAGDGTEPVVGPRVSGRLTIADAMGAGLVLVAVPGGCALVETTALSGLTALPCIDETTRLADAEAYEVAAVAYVPTEVDDVFRRGVLFGAAMLTGIAEAARDSAVEHAKVRLQFGQPIGSYQAVKHPCADMAVRAEAAASQLFFAAVSAETGRPDAAFQASASKIVASDAARRNAAANVQIHGGMGFSFEQHAHLYGKRAHVLAHAFGTPSFHLAAALEGVPAA